MADVITSRQAAHINITNVRPWSEAPDRVTIASGSSDSSHHPTRGFQARIGSMFRDLQKRMNLWSRRKARTPFTDSGSETDLERQSDRATRIGIVEGNTGPTLPVTIVEKSGSQPMLQPETSQVQTPEKVDTDKAHQTIPKAEVQYCRRLHCRKHILTHLIQ